MQPTLMFNFCNRTNANFNIRKMKRSGIQRDVLALYRLCLREAGKKPKVLTIHSAFSLFPICTNMFPASDLMQEVQDNFRNYARFDEIATLAIPPYLDMQNS